MKLDFESVLSHTLSNFEGGYVNDKADSGGETFAGISRVNNPDWPGWPLVDAIKDKHLGTSSTSLARFINNQLLNDPTMLGLLAERYYLNYWKPVENIESPKVRAKVFDFGVNAGPSTAIKMLQRIVGTKTDGVIGSLTNTAINNLGDVVVLNRFCQAMESFYRDLATKKPSYKKFLTGWLRRAVWKP